MANLNIETLNTIVQSGNTNKLFESKGLGSNAELHTSTNVQSGKSFSEVLQNSIEQVNEYQVQADTAIKELVAGRTKNIHETMLTIERADTSLKLMMQVRNKILDAYKEIMKMPV